MLCPPEGLCCPCEWVRNRDGDTPVVRLRIGECAVRLIDCWADKLSSEKGIAAKAFLDDLLGKNDDVLHVWIPLAEDRDGDRKIDIIDLLRSLITFDRVLGRLFIGSQDVSEIMVRHGYATETKES